MGTAKRLWALRRSDSLTDRGITHILSVVGFDPSFLKNFKDEPWSEYGKEFRHVIIDVDDLDEANILVEFPKAVRFIDEGLRGTKSGNGSEEADDQDGGGAALDQGMEKLTVGGDKKKRAPGVFVHCAAGKSRSVSAIIAYLLWRYPNRFDPNITPTVVSDPTHAQPSASSPQRRSRKETSAEAVHTALTFVRRTRPMAEPNAGFMDQLALWWEMGCPDDVETHAVYQRWAYKREVELNVAVGQAPTRLRFEDEEQQSSDESGLNLRCKKCRRTLATAPFIVDHKPAADEHAAACQHFFLEPMSWMRGTLELGELNGRLTCPNPKCGAGVGRYDWKGFKCSCGGWVTPAFSLQRAKIDDVVKRQASAGIRMPPGVVPRGGNL